MKEFANMRFTPTGGGEKNPLTNVMMRSLQQMGELSVPALRSLSPLSDKAQVLVDRAVVNVGLERLVFAADLMAAGLTEPISDPLSVMQLEWEQVSKIGNAQRTMSPSARGENQLVDRRIKRLPIYVTTDDFSVGIRTLKASQRVGTPIDVTQVEQATRRVNEAIEDAALYGATSIDGTQFNVGGYGAPGLLNAPNANTEALAVDWNGSNTIGTTGPAMIEDVLSMIGTLEADKKFGPYNLYIGTRAGNMIEGDFKVNTTGTIRQRIEAIEAGGRRINIRVADQMPTAATGIQAVLVEMTSDVVQMVVGQPPTVIPWTSLDGFTLYWLVMAIMVQRVRDDYEGNSGIVIGTKV